MNQRRDLTFDPIFSSMDIPNIKRSIVPLVVSLFCLVGLQAQQGVEFGGFLGASHYFGDLNTNFKMNSPGFSGGLIGRYNFNERVSIKLAGSYGKVSADDANSNNTFEQRRNLSFESPILDGSAQIEFNFLPYIHGSRDHFFTPYLLAGFSVTKFNPQTHYCASDPTIPLSQCNGPTRIADLRPLGTEGQFKGEEYYTVAGGFAFGMGLKIDLSYEWSINVEASVRRLFSDYLDDVSTVYPDMSDVENFRGELAVALSDRSTPTPQKIGEAGRQRGNSQNTDAIAFLNVGIVYYFGDLRCPKPSNGK